MDINHKIQALRQAMQMHNLDAYIIPSSDPHQSEYVANHWTSREWLSGFTGSAGVLVVTKDHAGLWTDSRYFLQAEQELANSEIVLHKQGPSRSPEHYDWLANRLGKGATVGIDGMLFSLNQNRQLAKILHSKGINLSIEHDLINDVWTDRPGLPTEKIFELEVEYAGQSRSDKFRIVREKIQAKGANYYLISALDEIAWLLNLRGRDIAFNPVFLAYVILSEKAVYLFVDKSKINTDLNDRLKEDGVVLKDYSSIKTFLSELSNTEKLYYNNATTSIGLYQSIPNDISISGEAIVQALKAVKNETEIVQVKQAMRYDGVALVKLYRWLENGLKQGVKITEAEVADVLAGYRSEQPGYYGESFPAIVGYQGNGAIVHYRPEHGKSAILESKGILLLDSGGQYRSGTTDITRTTALGEVTQEQIDNCTRVLKGHIGVAELHFPKGTKGYQLDGFARQSLWKAHLNFGHGTGHGVGFFLNVHEGPQGISPVGKPNSAGFVEGMLTSNEPGFYKTGEYGIRIENLVFNVLAGSSEYGDFLKFDTVTLFPIDQQLINIDMLTNSEIEWLNQYHEKVFTELSPLLDAEEKAWLAESCKAIKA